MISNVRNRLKFGKISRKDPLRTKCEKMDIENLIRRALIRMSVDTCT